MIELFTPRKASHSGGFFLFGIRDSGVFYMHMGVCINGGTELQQIVALSLKKILPGERAAINIFKINYLFYLLILSYVVSIYYIDIN